MGRKARRTAVSIFLASKFGFRRSPRQRMRSKWAMMWQGATAASCSSSVK